MSTTERPEQAATPSEEEPSVGSGTFDISRRNVLIGGAAVVATMGLPKMVFAVLPASAMASAAALPNKGEANMNMITVKDGTKIYFKDWGTGQPIVFAHGWPLNADAWDAQMLFLGQQGYRVIGIDQRGNGRSSQPWDGNDLDHYADDMSEVIEALDLQKAMLVGHSTGGGVVTRYLGRHGSKRVAKAVLIGAIPPLMVKTDANPEGLALSVFDGLREALVADRSNFYQELSMPFYGYNRPNAKVSKGVRDNFWLQGMGGSHKSQYDTIKAFSQTDLTEDLKKIDIPTLILHGDDDQIVPIVASALKSSKLVKGATLKIYPGAPHGMCTTLADKVNADLLEFIKS